MVVVARRWRPDSDESRCGTYCRPLCVSTEQLPLHLSLFYLHLSHKLKKLKPTWYFSLVHIASYVFFVTNFTLICLYLLTWRLGFLADGTSSCWFLLCFCRFCSGVLVWVWQTVPVVSYFKKMLILTVIMFSPTRWKSDSVFFLSALWPKMI